MFIKRIKLKNIRTYSNLDLEFSDGITLLSGNIGSGKSSILHAIEFALFGFLDKNKGNSLLKKGKNSGNVELHFSINKDDFVVYRELNKRKTSVNQGNCFLIKNNIKTTLRPSELDSKIFEILNYPQNSKLTPNSKKALFRYTVYTPQEQMKEILFGDSKQRLNTIRNLFQIQKYKNIAENSNIVKKYINNKIKLNREIIKEINIDINEIKTLGLMFKDHFDKKNSLTKKINNINEELKDLKKKRNELKDKIDSLNEIRLKQKSIESKIESINEQIRKKNKEIKEIKNKINLKNQEVLNKIDKINNLINDLNRFNNKKLKIIFESESFIDNYYDNKKAIDNYYEIINKDYISLNDFIIKMNSKQENLINELNKIKQEKQELNLKISKIPDKDINKVNAAINKVQKTISSRESIEKELDDINNKINTNNNQISKYKALIENLNNELKERIQKDICPVCKQVINQNHKQKLEQENKNKISSFNNIIDNLKKENNNLLNKQKDLKEKLKKINESYELLVKLNKLINELNNKKEYEEKINKINIRINEIYNELDKIDIKSKQKIYDELKNSLNLLQDINKLLDVIKSEFDFIALNNSIVESNEKDIIILNKNKDELIKEQKKLIESLKDYDIINNELNKIEIKIEDIINKLNNLNLELKLCDNELNNIKDKFIKIKEDSIKVLNRKKEIIFFENYYNFINNLIELANDIERSKMQQIHDELEGYIKDYFLKMVDSNEFNVNLDDEFKPIVEQVDYIIDVQDLSGGEKTSIALAYRLALNRVINDNFSSLNTKNILILDEPTDGFSESQIDKLRDILSELNLKQIIIVSHEAKIESFAQNIIKVYKENLNSYVDVL